mgnify:CR=1 FL=1
MANKKVVDYLKNGLSKGFSEKQLKKELSKVGWSRSQISSALQEIHGNSPKKPRKTQT